MTISYEDYIKKRSENADYYETEKLIKNYLSEQEQKKTKKKKKKKDTWFSAGAFEDGYDFGDLTKTTLSTAGDIGINAIHGAGSVVEGVFDLGSYGVAGAYDLFGNDKTADKIRKKAQKDTIGNLLQPGEDFFDKNSLIGEKGDQVSQGLGQVGVMIATGGAGASAGLGMAGQTAITTGLTFTSSMGSGMSEAYQSGATDEEAVKYGAIKGVGDASTELIFAGLGKTINAKGFNVGLSSADDMLARKVSSKINNQVARNFVEFGIKAGAEGSEEVLAGVISAVGKKVTYMSEEELGQILEDEKLLDQFIMGAVTSGFAQSGYIPGMQQGSLREANKTGRDFVTGYTQNEQRVIDSATEQRTTEIQKERAVEQRVNQVIAEREGTFGTLSDAEKKNIANRVKEQLDNGELDYTTSKLTKKEIAKIEAEVQEDFKKGYIDVDTIESTLSSEKTAQIKELEAQLDKTTNEQKKAEIQAQINEIKYARATEMSELLKNDGYLQNSYREEALKKQKFTYEATETDSDIRKSLAEDFSKIANDTAKTHELFETISKIAEDKQTSYGVINNEQLQELGYEVEGKTINGLVRVNADGTQKVLINIDSEKAINRIVGHETTHLLEGTNEYTELQEMVKEYAETKGDYSRLHKELTELYNGTDANIENELTADLVGDYLFTDTEFINQLSTKKPNIFQKIFNEIKHLYKLATAGSKEARQLEKVKKAFEKAYRKNAVQVKAKSDTKVTISEQLENKLDGEVKQELKDKKAMIDMFEEYLEENGITNPTEQDIQNSIDSYDVYDNEGDISDVEQKYIDTIKEYLAQSSTKDNKGRKLSKEQQEYFKDSKVRDAGGRLLAVYHGTKSDFNVFDMNKAGDNYEDGWSQSGKGFYFTEAKSEAKEFGESGIGDADTQIKEVYLNITNPFDTSIENLPVLAEIGKEYGVDPQFLQRGDYLLRWLRNNGINATEVLQKYGYDGIIDYGHYVVYDSNQIKNVDNTKPTSDPDIRYSLSDSKGNIKEVSTGYSSDEYFYEMQYIEDGKIAGKLNYGEYNGEPNVKMIEVKPEYQRKGIGTKLLQELQKKYAGIEIDFGMSTPDGTKLLEKATYTVEDAEVVEKQNRIGEIQNILDEYDKGFENYFDNDLPVPQNYAEDYNDLYDEMRRLQEEIRGKSATKRFVKTDNTKYSLSEDTQGRKLSDNQKEYFKNTEIVDKEGKLKVVYHGTPFGNFTTFKGKMFFFSEDYRFADDYANSKSFEQGLDGDIKVIEAYLKAENVFDATDLTDIQKLREALPNEMTYWGNTWDKETLLKKLQRKDTLPPKWKSEQIEGKQFGDYIGDDRYGYNTDMFVGVNEQNEIVYIPQERGLQQLTQAEKTYLENQLMSGNEVTYITYQTIYGDLTETQIQERIKELKKQAEEYKKDTGYENENIEYATKLLNDTLERIKKGYAEETQHKLKPKTTTQESTELDDIDNWTYFETAFDRETGKDVVDIIKDLGYDAINIYENGKSNYIVFNPNQIKNVENLNPTENPDINMSLSNQNQDIAPVRGDIFGSDIKLQVEEAIAPIKEEITQLKEILQTTIDDTAPVRQDIVEQQNAEAFSTINDSDMPVKAENTTPEDGMTPTKDLFETRDYSEVGNRKVNAYQYDNPEVKPYFQEVARSMLDDLATSVKGERHIIGDISQVGNGDYQYVGTPRFTSDDIAELLDGIDGKYKMTYKDIEKGLNAIIKDEGAENNANSKRIEFYLDKRLREGFTTLDGAKIPANQGYLNTLNGIEATEQYGSVPIGETPVEDASNTEVVEGNIPIKNTLGYIPKDPTRAESYEDPVQDFINKSAGSVMDNKVTPAKENPKSKKRIRIRSTKPYRNVLLRQ